MGTLAANTSAIFSQVGAGRVIKIFLSSASSIEAIVSAVRDDSG